MYNYGGFTASPDQRVPEEARQVEPIISYSEQQAKINPEHTGQ